MNQGQQTGLQGAGRAEQSSGWFAPGMVLLLHTALFALVNGNFDHDFDAQQYGRIAHEISKGEYVLAVHPFSQRFMVTVPAAALFKWFGTHWLTASLWPLLASLLTIALVHRVVRFSAGSRAAFLAAALLATNLIQVRFASRLLPDVFVSAFMLLAGALIQRGREGERKLLSGALAAVALLLGLLAKATVVWVAPFILGLLAIDLARGKNRRLWVGFLAGSAICATAFFGGYYALTGDAMYRINGIESIHNTRAGFFEGGLSQFASRLTYAPLLYLLARPGFGLALLLAAPAVVMAARAPRGESSVARYWTGYCLVVMASFWFGTTSMKVYTPLYLADRFLMPFLAPLAILGGITVAHVLNASDRPNRSRLELVPLLFGAGLTALVLFGEGFKRAMLYAILTGLSGLLATRYRSSAAAPLTAMILLAMSIPVADYAYRGDPMETPDLIQLERDNMAATFPMEGPPVAVITDPHSAFVLPFYLTPEARERTRFLSWDDPESAPREGERLLLYIHQPRLVAVNLNWGQRVPPFAREHVANWKPLARDTFDEKHFILLFEIEDPAAVLKR